MDSGATHLYIAPNTPHGPLDTNAATIRVGISNGNFATSVAKNTLHIPQLAADFPTMVYIMSSFTNTLIGVGPTCDANCTVVFKKNDVTVLSPEVIPFSKGVDRRNLQNYGASLSNPTIGV